MFPIQPREHDASQRSMVGRGLARIQRVFQLDKFGGGAADHHPMTTPPSAEQVDADTARMPRPLQEFRPLQAFWAVLQSPLPLQLLMPAHFTVGLALLVVAELTGAAIAAASTADVKASAVTVREADMLNSFEWLLPCADR